jgi:SAM-dependent methyltransferase
MHGLPTPEAADIDWGRTSGDYASHRPNYPAKFFDLLKLFGIGLPGQRILDLGTGVGFLALRFAEQGADVTGIDIAPGQIEQARAEAPVRGLRADFRVARAEDSGLPSASFDVITASQCWLYFDATRMIAEAQRLLRPRGLLMTSHLCWLPRQEPIARMSEELIQRHNPAWTSADWSGEIPFMPKWAAGAFPLHAMFVFDEPLRFTRESWRGRIRACRGVGASLPPEKVAEVDRELDELLRAKGLDLFTILHRVDAHIFRVNGAT